MSKQEYLDKLLAILKPEQIVVYEEAIINPMKTLSLPLGFGKTITSLAIMMYNLTNSEDPSLIVASKALLGNWNTEIKRFLGPEFPYKILHSGYNKDLSLDDSWVFLCTPNIISKEFSTYNIHNRSIDVVYNARRGLPAYHYIKTTGPLAQGGKFYTRKWSTLIVDEAQKYTNITSNTCKALIALWCSDVRLLSGTIIDDPKMSKLLGYYMMIKYEFVPNSLSEFTTFVKIPGFEGAKVTMIHRDKTESFIKPKVIETIVDHEMTENERKVYTGIRNSLITMNNIAKTELNIPQHERVFSQALLCMILRLRQCILCPIIPLTKLAIDTCKQNNPVSDVLLDELNKSDLKEYLNDESSLLSSRADAQMNIIDKHPDQHVIVFSAFRVYLDLMEYLLKREFEREIIFVKSQDSSKKRSEKIEHFRNSGNGVLLITFGLGAEGLNLQFCSVSIISDMWWNCAKVQQSVGRTLRPGQLSKEVYIYLMTSNTAIENCLLRKQNDKQNVTDALLKGAYSGKVHSLNIEDIINIVEMEANKDLLGKNRYCS